MKWCNIETTHLYSVQQLQLMINANCNDIHPCDAIATYVYAN